jgi:hypothetical protein
MADRTFKRTGTRSQASINDYFCPVAPDQSPLKAARRAARTKSGPTDDVLVPSTSQTTAQTSSAHNDIMVPSGSRKRSSSPDRNTRTTGERAAGDERQMKRPKLDDTDTTPRPASDNAPPHVNVKSVFDATRPQKLRALALPSMHSPVKPTLPGTPSRRARSVPPTPSPSKVVDLRSLSPSRHGTPSASPERRLRFTSVPPMIDPTVEDEDTGGMCLDPFIAQPPSSDSPSEFARTSPPVHDVSGATPIASGSSISSSGVSDLRPFSGSPPSPLTPVPTTPASFRPPMKSVLEDLWMTRSNVRFIV